MKQTLITLSIMACKFSIKLAWLLTKIGVQLVVLLFTALLTTKKTTKKRRAVLPPTKIYQYKKHKYTVSRCRNSAGKTMYRKVYQRDNGSHYINYLNNKFTVKFDVQTQTWEL